MLGFRSLHHPRGEGAPGLLERGAGLQGAGVGYGKAVEFDSLSRSLWRLLMLSLQHTVRPTTSPPYPAALFRWSGMGGRKGGAYSGKRG
jgi:hypothetical protein